MGHSGKEKKLLEKRKYKRYKVKDLTFVKLCYEDEIDIGQLMDISRGGLALRYFVNSDKARNYSNLSIFLSEDNFIIDKISFKTISNTEIANGSNFSTIVLRRYGIEFENLTENQITELDYFLKHYTLGEA